ncbi:hypothetical protein [Tsukamurella soli]|uniref:Uncharacterized protein n=1 Tax=Tsukamurella soli TaxID=644556 RepID=A0ABP8JJ81_9ACTN
MTAADPAVAAAERAEKASRWWESAYSSPWSTDHAEAAAREALAPIRELHKRWTVYGDECDHHITEDPHEVGNTHPDGEHHYVAEIGWTCDRLYDVCAECCVDDIYQSEECVNYHDHRDGVPICATARLCYPEEEL